MKYARSDKDLKFGILEDFIIFLFTLYHEEGSSPEEKPRLK